jgi:hypothetical protein
MRTGISGRDSEKQDVSGCEFQDITEFEGWSSMEPEDPIQVEN